MTEKIDSGRDEKQGQAKPRSDLRTQKTRKALVDAFVELSEIKWIEDITVAEICERAMVRRATFYHHFEDKYELFAYVMNGIQRDVNLKQNANPKEISMADYCLNICRAYQSNYRERPKMVRRIMSSRSRDSFADILVGQIRNAIRAKAKHDEKRGIFLEIDTEVLAGFVAGAIPTVNTLFQSGSMNAVDEEKYFAELRKIFERLCSEK